MGKKQKEEAKEVRKVTTVTGTPIPLEVNIARGYWTANVKANSVQISRESSFTPNAVTASDFVEGSIEDLFEVVREAEMAYRAVAMFGGKK